jgi:hypothetical protein
MFVSSPLNAAVELAVDGKTISSECAYTKVVRLVRFGVA